MAAARRSSRKPTKLAKAKATLVASIGRTAKRSVAVNRACTRVASMRTCRAARKALGVSAVRQSRQGGKRGRGVWYATR
jgi:hypothetical protein